MTRRVSRDADDGSSPWYVWPNPMRTDGAFIAIGPPTRDCGPPRCLLQFQVPHADAEKIVALCDEHPILRAAFEELLYDRWEPRRFRSMPVVSPSVYRIIQEWAEDVYMEMGLQMGYNSPEERNDLRACVHNAILGAFAERDQLNQDEFVHHLAIRDEARRLYAGER